MNLNIQNHFPHHVLHVPISYSRETEFLEAIWKKIEPRKNQNLKLNVSIILICHLISDSLSLINFINNHFYLEAIIPKPKSINENVIKYIDGLGIKIIHCKREELLTQANIIELILDRRQNENVVLLDMGGYFAPILDILKSKMGTSLLGVIEDTENGIQRYQCINNLNTPVFSVADSSLKRPENRLVGISAIESILKTISLNALEIKDSIYGIIGFGKIGEEISDFLKIQNKKILIYDKNPIKLIHARSLGYKVISKDGLLTQSDIIISVTGGHAIDDQDLKKIRPTAIIASITSADDEFMFSKKYWKIFNLMDKTYTKYVEKIMMKST